MKKILGLFLCGLILLSNSYALSLSPEGQKELAAADFLAEQGIIKDVRSSIDITGTEYELIGGGETMAVMDAYRLYDTITRKEVIKVVMKLSGKTIEDTCAESFSDVSNDWGCKYIEAALESGYIAANDVFRPDDNITKTEAMKLVLKAKGVQKIQETDNWQEDYMMTAYEYDIVDQKYYDYNADATRGWIFMIATATIEKEEEIIEKGGIISDEAM